MKKLILLLSLSFFLIGTTSAQEATNSVLNESFVEWNFGVAFLDGMDYPFPGTSVLWGESYTNENNLIFEFEVGFALPTLVTAKLGIGKKFNNTKVVVGIRPFPFNIYGQASFFGDENGYWIVSLEYNPMNPSDSFSRGILNFGYRWNLDVIPFW